MSGGYQSGLESSTTAPAYPPEYYTDDVAAQQRLVAEQLRAFSQAVNNYSANMDATGSVPAIEEAIDDFIPMVRRASDI